MRAPLLAATLCALTVAAYAGVWTHEFSSFDTADYVVRNVHIEDGLSLASLRWAVELNGYKSNWHPLTWLSHALDVELFGLEPAGHHATNVVLHVLAALTLFVALRRGTAVDPSEAADDARNAWRCAGVVAVFALHPLHVESVAWIAERKDVLCAFLWMACLSTYVEYVRRGRSPTLYACVVVLFGLALASKPMASTLPFVLLLVDYWPLGRLAPERGWSRRLGALVVEKLPLFALSAASAWVTLRAQRMGGGMKGLADLSAVDRIATAVYGYGLYLAKLAWPVDLAVFYPHPGAGALLSSPWLASVVLSACALVAASMIALWRLRSEPWLAVGWFWFLGTLVPVSGLVAVGAQLAADRYTYLPSLGIGILAVWGVGGLADRLRLPRWAPAAGATLVALLWTAATAHQVSFWENDERLFGRAVEVTRDNHLAHGALGLALVRRGVAQSDPETRDRGLEHARLGVEIKRTAITQRALAESLYIAGRYGQAELEYRGLLKMFPREPSAHRGLGNLYFRQRRFLQAADAYRDAARFSAGTHDSNLLWANALWMTRRPEQAVDVLRESLAVRPDWGLAHSALGELLCRLARCAEGLEHLRRGVALTPDLPDLRERLAAWLEREGEREEAVRVRASLETEGG